MFSARRKSIAWFAARILGAVMLAAFLSAAVHAQDAGMLEKAAALAADARALVKINRIDTVEAAIPKFAEAASIYRELNNAGLLKETLTGQCIALRQIGNYYLSEEKWTEAIAAYESALSISRENKDRAADALSLHSLGYIASSQKRNDEALDFYKQALQAYRDEKDRPAEAIILRNLGVVYGDQNRPREAAEQLSAALSLAVELKDTELETKVSSHLGDIYYSLADYDKAEVQFKRLLVLRREQKNAENEASTLIQLGHTDLARFRTETARVWFEQAAEIYRQVKDANQEIYARIRIARSYLIANKLDIALEKFQELLNMAVELKDGPHEAEILLALAVTNRTYRRLDTAMEYSNKALAKYRELKNREGEGNTLLNIGGLLTETGQANAAVVKINEAGKIFLETNDEYGQGSVYRALGWTYYEQSKFSEAIAVNLRGVELARKFSDWYGESEALTNIANCYSAIGLYEKSTEASEQVLAIALKSGSRNHESIVLSNIGYNYFRQQKYDKAKSYLERAIAIMQAEKYRREEGYAVHNLGLVYYKLGNYPEALKRYDQALILYLETKERRPESFLYDSYGELYRDIGQFDKAAANLERSLMLSREIKYSEVEANALSNLMELWKRRSKPRLAVFYGKQAVNTLQYIRSSNRGLDKESQKSLVQSNEKTYRRLADLLVEEGRLPEAQQVLDLLKQEEYFEFVRRDATEAANQAKLALNETERKALEQYNVVSGQLTALGTRFQELTDKRSASGKLSEADNAEFLQLKKQIEDAGEGLKTFLGGLSAEFSKKVEDGAVVTTQSIETMRADLRRAGKDVVLISTYLLPERYRAIVTTGRTMVDRKVEYKDIKLTAADINKKIAEFKQALQNPHADPRPLGKELYDIFVKPLEGDLRGAKAKTLLWSLDGSLRYIPIAALSPDGKTYMAEHYQNVIVTLARQTNLFAKPTTDDWRAVGAGVSKQHEGFSALPSVTREINSIVKDAADKETAAGVLGGRKMLDEAFSLNTFRSVIAEQSDEGKPFNVVHLATHFSLGATNQDSALLLGDGRRLSLYEISRDEELDFKDIELLTLSACETGVSTGEANGREVESLGMLAQQKGAKAVLATLWKVADESTSLFMSEFYRLKKETPAMAKSEAVRQAQLAMIQGRIKSSGNSAGCRSEVFTVGKGKTAEFKCDANAPFSHPYFWSPFVLIGNWK